jgi:hypothetical protein
MGRESAHAAIMPDVGQHRHLSGKARLFIPLMLALIVVTSYGDHVVNGSSLEKLPSTNNPQGAKMKESQGTALIAILVSVVGLLIYTGVVPTKDPANGFAVIGVALVMAVAAVSLRDH